MLEGSIKQLTLEFEKKNLFSFNIKEWSIESETCH